jgi:cellulose synthase/poly-beta-1,6-N-acetylglucosamine synthase-like glycosyltransferase
LNAALHSFLQILRHVNNRLQALPAHSHFTQVLLALDWAMIAYFVLVNTCYAGILISAALDMRERVLVRISEFDWQVLGSKLAPQVSVIVPAHNEAATIAESIRSLLTLNYPRIEIVVVNDGSKDATLEVLCAEFLMHAVHPTYAKKVDCAEIVGLYQSARHPNLLVIDKKNGGKADALNAGLNFAGGDLVCAIDADSIIEPDAFLHMVRPFLASSDVCAAGGTIRVANGASVVNGKLRAAPRAPLKPLVGFQVIEYLRAFLFGRLGWNQLGGNLIVSGAFGMFRRQMLLDAGGYRRETVGEDIEVTARLRAMGYESRRRGRVEFIPDPVAWTEVPESMRVLGRQRDRWHRGLAETLWRHRRMFLNPRYGLLGLFVMPYFVVIELFAPAVELFGLFIFVAAWLLHAISVQFMLLFFAVAYGYGVVLSIGALVLEEFSYQSYPRFTDRLLLLLWALTENLGYRQLTVLWRVRGMLKFLVGRRDWGRMERRGFKLAAKTA